MTNWCIVYLASPKDFIIEPKCKRIEALKASINISRRVFPDIDIIVFHEDYTDTEFQQLPGVTTFIKVDFESDTDEFVHHYRNKGYMMMCRFFSGIMQKHPELQRYSHYLRLDDDSYLLEPYIDSNLMNDLLKNDYVYRSIFHDKKNHRELFEYTVSFLMKNGIPMYKIYQHINTYIPQFLDVSGCYSGLAPYNNFHVSSLNLWNHPLVSSFVNSLEKDKCILKKGWMDANIHAMIIYVVAPFTELKIKECTTFGYRHNQHLSLMNSLVYNYDSNLPFIEQS